MTGFGTHSSPRIVIYPGERQDRKGVTVGHLYAFSLGNVRKYDAVGGPPPGKGYRDVGGHTAGITPPGHYVLDRAEHHATNNWPKSVVPWGAAIRDRDGVIEYQLGGVWKAASGRFGAVTDAIRQFAHRSRDDIGLLQADVRARAMFFADGVLITQWNRNDFGKWSWNLRKDGHRSAYYIHTTAADEAATAAGEAFDMLESHGCIHVRPVDRDEMMKSGILRAGTEVEVKRYGLVGPS